MKRIALSVFSLSLTFAAMAQIKEGSIVYERKINVHRRIKDDQLKAMLPEFRTNKQLLLFSDSISVYKAVEEDNQPDPFENSSGPGGVRKIAIGGQNNVLYTNFGSQKIIEQSELNDKTYLITDTVKQKPWKITEETKTILSYPCKKATMQTATGQEVIAWYTESIFTTAGPEKYNGLPGTVLQVDVNNSEIVFTALEVKNKVEKKDLKEPSKGKIITRADYNAKVKETIPGGIRISM